MTKYKAFHLEQTSNVVHYFDEYQLDYFGIVDAESREECSLILDGLPFKMCMSMEIEGDRLETRLYFKKELSIHQEESAYAQDVKTFIDTVFETSVFRFDSDVDWDEIQ